MMTEAAAAGVTFAGMGSLVPMEKAFLRGERSIVGHASVPG
jgi:hypothetical protein